MSKDESATGGLDNELQAVRAIVSALKPLDAEARERVLASSMNLLGSGHLPRLQRSAVTESDGTPSVAATDIRSLREQKRPKSAVEMAAIVAFYLSESAAVAERRNYITTSDIATYFKQAMYPMPSNINMALVHAKNAGYLDQLGEGRYRLNPVGYNLVAHSLPRDGSETPVSSGTRRAKSKRRK